MWDKTSGNMSSTAGNLPNTTKRKKDREAERERERERKREV